MSVFDKTLEQFLVLICLSGLAILLRSRSSILKEEQGVFARLVTEFALPSLIFCSISLKPFTLDHLLPAAAIFSSIALVMIAAWLIGRALKLSRPVLGSVILVAGVGSSSTLGYSIIKNVFHNNHEIMNQVVIMGEFGVILPLFTFGVMIAMYFGQPENSDGQLLPTFLKFFRSPIFIATILGVAFSHMGLDQESWLMRILYDLLKVIGASLDVLVAFAIGLMLRPIDFRKLLPIIAIVVGLKLVLEPVLAWTIAETIAETIALPTVSRELLIIEAAMPSGTIAAVLAARYGCDGAVASSLVVTTYLVSLVALPIVLAFTV